MSPLLEYLLHKYWLISLATNTTYECSISLRQKTLLTPTIFPMKNQKHKSAHHPLNGSEPANGTKWTGIELYQIRNKLGWPGLYSGHRLHLVPWNMALQMHNLKGCELRQKPMGRKHFGVALDLLFVEEIRDNNNLLNILQLYNNGNKHKTKYKTCSSCVFKYYIMNKKLSPWTQYWQ